MLCDPRIGRELKSGQIEITVSEWELHNVIVQLGFFFQKLIDISAYVTRCTAEYTFHPFAFCKSGVAPRGTNCNSLNVLGWRCRNSNDHLGIVIRADLRLNHCWVNDRIFHHQFVVLVWFGGNHIFSRVVR